MSLIFTLFCDILIPQELCQASLADALDHYLLHDRTSGRPQRGLLLDVLLGVASGLAHLHRAGVVHGALTPNSILLQKTSLPGGSRITVKINDFALGSLLYPPPGTPGHNNPLGEHSRHPSVVPFYLAPEVALSGLASKEGDIFSFGVIMIELFSRVNPYLGIGNGVFERNPHFLSSTSEFVPLPVLLLAESCLAVDPALRPGLDQVLGNIQVRLMQSFWSDVFSFVSESLPRL